MVLHYQPCNGPQSVGDLLCSLVPNLHVLSTFTFLSPSGPKILKPTNIGMGENCANKLLNSGLAQAFTEIDNVLSEDASHEL